MIFLAVGPSGSDQCQKTLDSCLSTCSELGVPIEDSKTILPTTCYLGFILDSVLLELRLPKEKDKVLSALSLWKNKRSGLKHDLLSLIDLLQHCTQAIPLGRPFLRRLINRANYVKELYRFVRLSTWEQDDIDWWHRLVTEWNGRSLFLSPGWEKGPDLSVTSDAAGSQFLGFGAYQGTE